MSSIKDAPRDDRLKCVLDLVYDSAQDTAPVEIRIGRVIKSQVKHSSITILDCPPRILTDALAEAEALGLYAHAGDGGVIID